MIDWSWITTTGPALLMVLLSGIGIFGTLLLLTRLVGLRSFSKMSSFDFSLTVALGTIIASTVIAKDPSLIVGAFALVVIYGIQFFVSSTRRLSSTVRWVVDNEPLLVMVGEEVLSEHLNKARMTEDDLRSKLRMAGITHPKQVLAVVFETTGDVSVLKTSDEVTPWLFEDVRGTEHLPFIRGEE